MYYIVTAMYHIVMAMYQLLESLQNRAAWWICGSRWSPPPNSWTIPSSDCCSQLSLPTLQTRRQFLSISFLHDIYHQCTSINFNFHFKFIQFYLPEVIIYHCVHLSQQSILVVIYSLSILSFCGIPYHYTFSMTPTPNLSGILYTVMCVLIDVAFVCFCVFCI